MKKCKYKSSCAEYAIPFDQCRQSSHYKFLHALFLRGPPYIHFPTKVEDRPRTSDRIFVTDPFWRSVRPEKPTRT